MSTTISPQVRLANDIAAQFPHRTREQAAETIADHIRKFWDPRMRADLSRRQESEPESFDPAALRAARILEGETG